METATGLPAHSAQNSITSANGNGNGNGHHPDEDAELEDIVAASYRLFITSLADHAVGMIDLLIVRKELPTFYFHQAAELAGIPKQAYRNWKLKTWATTPMRKHSRIQDISQTLLLVCFRLARYPHEETYWQAVERLQVRIRHLLQTHSRNSLTQLLHMPNGSIDKLLRMENRPHARYNHCPWALLQKLDDADLKLNAQSELELACMANLVDHAQDDTMPEPVEPPAERLDRYLIPMQSDCWKCESPWPHLVYEGPILGTDMHSYYCRTCGSLNVCKTPVVERHTRCGNCSLSWWNLRITEQTADGYNILTCPRCKMTNVTPPKGVPAQGYRLIHGITRDEHTIGDGQDTDDYEMLLAFDEDYQPEEIP